MSLRNDAAEDSYQAASQKMAEGRYDVSKRWLLTEGENALAALTRYPAPRPIYALRTAQELSEEAEAKLLEFAAALGEGDEPATLNFNAATAADLSRSALRRGWVLEAHVKGFDTPLADRADLKPDPAAQAFALEHSQSEAFADFYRPIWQTDAERQGLKPFEEEVASFRENVGAEGEGVYLTNNGIPVAAGVVDYDAVATMTLIGVSPEHRRQGWGTRLHRHLMWVAKEHTDRYRGQTSVDNAVMLRLFEKNGCTEVAEVWQLVAPVGAADAP